MSGRTVLTAAADTEADTDAEFAHIVAELTRRGFLGGALGTAALLGLTACGSSAGGTGGDGSGSAGSGTRTVQSAKGPIEVPATPRRVVAIQPSALATILDVGGSVVGTYDEGEQYVTPRYLPKWQAASKVGTGGQVNVEKIAALDPDLVVGLDYSWNTDVYADLTKLAPTVIAPTTSWTATARCVADAVNRSAELEALVTKLAQRSAAIKTQYATTLQAYRWDILQGGFDKGQFWLYGPKSDAGVILADAGVQYASGSAQTPGNANRPLSYERIDVLSDADVIGFYANFDGTPNNEAPQLFAQPGFKALAAAKNKRLVPLPDFLPGGYGDALALLDELEAGLKRLQNES